MADETASDRTAAGTLASGPGLREDLGLLGQELGDGLGRVLAAVPGQPGGPQALAAALGLDKVLASRVLKALRQRDPLAVVHGLPGPEPLRRLLRAARRRGADPRHVQAAARAVDRFEALIRAEAGDRSALDAMIASWLPAARSEFELRRKQAAFKAVSQLKGAEARVSLSAVWLAPSASGARIDVVWLMGLLGLKRLRPGATVKLATRRIAREESPRRPRDLGGDEFEDLEEVRLDEFCTEPPGRLEVRRAGDRTHYVLAGTGFGPRSAVDLILAEVNREEMARWVEPDLGRKGYVFADVGTPARVLVMDVFCHRDVYPGSEPELQIYDTSIEGVADVNDRSRDIDRLDVQESIQPLETGRSRPRLPDVPNYLEMLDHVNASLAWDPSDFRGWRCRIDYPIYGSQIAVAFEPSPPPA